MNMRTRTITPEVPIITAAYPMELKNLKHSINTGINRVKNSVKPETNIHYTISKERNGGYMVSVREKGFSNWLKSFSKKNRIQQPVSKEELEHGIIGNEFTPAFLKLQKTHKYVTKNLAKIEQHHYNEAIDYLS